MNFKGVITALATPFINGQVDYGSLEKLVKKQVADGIKGFVVNGTTGESPTLKPDEVKKIFIQVRASAPKNIPVIVGTGTNSTENSIELTRQAQVLGADAALVVVPYYNKPNQEGLFEHFKAIAQAVPNLPIILYNVPGRTITQLELGTIAKLSEIKNIVGIKEASGNIEFAKQIRAETRKDFILLSGDDATYGSFVQAGGDGVISVASHILPSAMINAQISENLNLINLLFSEANPIPLKMALHLMGLFESSELRLPLTKLPNDKTEILKKEMKARGIL